MPRNHHDALFRAVFSKPDQAIAHLKGVLPVAVRRHLDLDSLRVLSGSFVDDALTDRHADLLFAVDTASGGEALVYVLFEHQSTPDPQMPFRLLVYVTRILQRHLDAHPGTRQLPVVLPLVLYHGRAPWSVPRSLAQMYDLPEGALGDLGGTYADCRYLLEDLGTVDDLELKGKALGRMALLLLKHGREGELWARLPGWLSTLRGVMQQSGLEALETVLRYVAEVEADPPPPALWRRLADRMGPQATEVIMSWGRKLREEGRAEGREQGRAEGREEGRAEGRAEGREQGMRATLLQLLERRFGDVSATVRSRVEGGDVAQLQQWIDRILVGTSPEDVVS